MGLLDSARRQVGKNHQSKTRTDRLDPRRRVSREPAGPNARQSVCATGLGRECRLEPVEGTRTDGSASPAALREYRAPAPRRDDRPRDVSGRARLNRQPAQALACREREVRPCQFSRETDRRVDRFVDGPGTGNAVPPSAERGVSLLRGTGLSGQFGRYRILRTLGQGAMGTVYLAEDTQLERQIAAKTPHFRDDADEESLERLLPRGAWRPCFETSISAPSLTSGRSTGRTTVTMAFIEGRPLSAFIQPDKPQPERQILIVIRKLCLALPKRTIWGPCTAT